MGQEMWLEAALVEDRLGYGGRLAIENSGSGTLWYNADWGQAFPPGRTYRTHQDINRQSCHGYSGGNLGVVTSKYQTVYNGSDTPNLSQTAWYRCPSNASSCP